MSPSDACRVVRWRRTPTRAARALLAAMTLGATACGSGGDQSGNDFGNLLASPGGLVVLREEHPSGWARRDCLTCHEVRKMHIVNRTDLPSCDTLPSGSFDPCIDLHEIQSIIRNRGQNSCVLCHGANGAYP